MILTLCVLSLLCASMRSLRRPLLNRSIITHSTAMHRFATLSVASRTLARNVASTSVQRAVSVAHSNSFARSITSRALHPTHRTPEQRKQQHKVISVPADHTTTSNVPRYTTYTAAGAAAASTAATPETVAVSESSLSAVEIANANGALTSFAPPLNPENPFCFLPRLCQDALIMVHDVTGLPWWASIMVMTVITRSVFIWPLTTGQQQATAGMQLCKPDLEKMGAEFETVKAAYAKMMQPVPLHVIQDNNAKRKQIMAKHGWSMWKQFRTIVFTTPIFLSFFWSN